MSVILNPSLVILNEVKNLAFFAQDKLREESHRINELKMEILRLQPQNDIMTQSRQGSGHTIYPPVVIAYILDHLIHEPIACKHDYLLKVTHEVPAVAMQEHREEPA